MSRASVAASLPAPERLAAPSSTGAPAAVLIPLFQRAGETHTIFTQRRADLRRHAGEVSFPGGRPDPEDADLAETALREAWEEVGLDPSTAEVIDRLDPVDTRVTGYLIHPFIATVPDDSVWVPNPTEVAELIEVPISALERGYAKRIVNVRGLPLRTATYAVDGHIIWGATARIVEQLLERLATPPA
jgi:8-oxo-dGTP pyrophosphatase MutT (NUDIX family)